MFQKLKVDALDPFVYGKLYHLLPNALIVIKTELIFVVLKQALSTIPEMIAHL